MTPPKTYGSAINDLRSQASERAPLTDRSGDASKGESFSRALIIGLRDRVGPIAIVRLIVPLIVSALDGVIHGRSRPHVFQECPKGLPPATADLNASGAIVFVVATIRAIASLHHAAPRLILRPSRPGQAIGLIRSRPCATARGRSTRVEVRKKYGASFSALTSADHIPMTGATLGPVLVSGDSPQPERRSYFWPAIFHRQIVSEVV